MAITDESNGFYMPVAPAYQQGNGTNGWGGDWAWIILLLLAFGGGWGNGFGGFGGGMDGGLYPWLNNSQNINGGFRDQMLNTSINGIQNSITSGFGDVQTALCGGFAGVNSAITNAQMADMERSFAASIPCRSGYVYHEDETGIFILRGVVKNQCACNAVYQVTFNGNIAIPEGGTVVPIAIAIAVNGEPRLTSRAIFTPAAAEDYGNVTSTAIVTVPRGCCFTVSVDYVAANTTDTPAPAIDVQNANVVINRIA